MDTSGAIRSIASPGYQERLLWAVRVRWLVIGGFLALALITQPLGLFPEVWACVLAATVGGGVNGANHWAVRQWRAVLPITLVAIPMDSVLITFVAAHTGGAASPFIVMYPVQVVATAMLVSFGAAVASGIVAVCAFGGLLWMAAAGLIAVAPPYSPWLAADAGRAALLGQGAWLAFLVYCLGLLIFVGGFVSQRLRASEDALEERNRRLAESVASLALARDDLARAYASLQAAEVQLVQSEKMRALGELVAGVVHELNNPLALVSANVEHLRGTCERLAEFLGAVPQWLDAGGRGAFERHAATMRVPCLLAELPEVVGDCEEGVRRAAVILGELRAFARAESGESPVAVDVNEGVRRTVGLMRHRSGDRVAVHLNLAEVPEVRGAPGQLNQMLLNLLVNAVDAIAGTGNIWIGSSYDPTGGTVRLSVRDDGQGIAPENLARVFDPFFTTKEIGKGMGLGLSISYGIVSRHGGTIAVSSEQGRGTVFEVVLPVVTRP